MIQPKVSVVIPVYNAERFVNQCLCDMRSQTLQEVEIICIDDGSTDATLSIIESHSAEDDRVKVLSQSNSGAGLARNKGITVAQGDFIAFFDVDDRYSSSRYLEELYEGAVRTNQLAAAGVMHNDRGEEGLETDFSESPYHDGYSFSKEEIIEYVDYQFDYGFTRFIYARELFEDDRCRFPGLSYFEDPVFFVRTITKAKSFFATNKVAYLYRCSYKQCGWTTDKVLDFLEGVRLNLDYSRKHSLNKLHWYTAHHFDFELGGKLHGVSIEFNRNLDLPMIERKLAEVEQAIDTNMLACIKKEDKSFMSRMSQNLQARKKRPAFLTKVGQTVYGFVNR